MGDAARVALAARTFTLAALCSLAALSGRAYLTGAAWVVAVAVTASLATLLPQVTVRPCRLALAEGVAVALVAAVVQPHGTTVTPYLVIPALIAALDAGRRGLVVVTGLEFAVLAAATAAAGGGWDRAAASSLLTWLTAAVGIGLMGLLVRRAPGRAEQDGAYRSALALVRRLEALSGRLSRGLDPVATAEQVMALAEERVPARATGVLVRSDLDGGLAPLRFSGGTPAGGLPWAEGLAERCRHDRAPVRDDRHLAVPMTVDGDVVAVLVLDAVAPVTAAEVHDLDRRLSAVALQLQVALVFSRVRDAATSDERHRIAREVHDGVAQDVASLGYLVDDLAAGTTDPAQLDRLALLRGEVSRVVGDLRHSVFDLRHEVGAGTGLGESLAAYAHQVGSTCALRVHVTLDEEGPRLPRDVEREVLRIAQEAMTNARKHADATALWLHCTVRAPYAEVEVCDDGTRAHAPRPDSQGLHIMRERARSVGAHLEVQPPAPGAPGTRVLVRVGRRPAALVPVGSRAEPLLLGDLR